MNAAEYNREHFPLLSMIAEKGIFFPDFEQGEDGQTVVALYVEKKNVETLKKHRDMLKHYFPQMLEEMAAQFYPPVDVSNIKKTCIQVIE